MNLVRGQKAPVSDLTSDARLTVTVTTAGLDIDVACFGLDPNGKLSDDRYMVFFNQPASPNGEVRMSSAGTATVFELNLAALPSNIERLCFTAASDTSPLSALSASQVTIAGASATATFAFSGKDFATEKAVMLADVYLRSNVWRVAAVGQGFADGLDALVRHFGGQVADAPPPVPNPPAAPSGPGNAVDLAKRDRQISLDKTMATDAPKLLSLAKKASVSLEKRGLGTHTAKVALVLDISASMGALYKSGKVQAIAERILALGTRFDDDGSIDLFLFGQDAHEAGQMQIENHAGFVERLMQEHRLEGGTRYGRAMALVRQFYFGSSAPRSTPMANALPVYVMFVTDGATLDKADTERELISSSYEPIFWQFLGLGMSSRTPGAKKKGGLRGMLSGGEFEFLERLDDLPGRHVDNADFFAVKDPSTVSDDEIFELLMEEYPGWLTQARAKGLLN